MEFQNGSDDFAILVSRRRNFDFISIIRNEI